MYFAPTKVRRIKFWWHLTVAYIQRYKLRIAIILLAILFASFILYRVIPTLFRNNVVSIGYVGNYTVDSLPSQVLALATQPLISKDEAGKNVPALASHWTLSDDGKTYVVFLKDNLRWHDLSLVEAKDISIAISNVEISALNNKAIQFKLPNPISSFPQALNTPVFKRKSFYGTGDFRITDIKQVESSVKKITLLPKDNKLPKVEIKFYATENLATNALKIGEVKVLSVSNAKVLESWPNLNVKKEVDNQEIVTIFYNTQDPKLSSKELRQALSYATVKDEFDGSLASSPISFTSWAYNPSIKKYDYNLGKAKELFSKAELIDPKITLSYIPGFENLATKIASDWEALGVHASLKEEKTIPKNFQALLAIDKLPTDPDQYSLWHSTQKDTNVTKYTDERIDKLLEDARVAQTEEERKTLYLDFQKFLTEGAPATFLYYPYKYTLSYKNIQHLLDKLPKGN